MKRFILFLLVLISLGAQAQTLEPVNVTVHKSNGSTGSYSYLVWENPYDFYEGVTYTILRDGVVIQENFPGYIPGSNFVHYPDRIKGKPTYEVRVNYNGGSSDFVEAKWVNEKKDN
jgi:hypothetical protein